MKKHPLGASLIVLVCAVFLLPLWLLGVQALIPAFDAMLAGMYAEPVRLAAAPVTEQFELLLSRRSDLFGLIGRDTLRCAVTALVQVMVSVTGGYLLAKYRSRFTKRVVFLFTMTLVLPLQMFLVPVYWMTEWAGISGNPYVMYVTAAFSPLGAILMRQVYLKMPDEWMECFRLEDTRLNRALAHIVFPAGLPAACVLFLFSFVEAWSMIEQPLLLVADPQLYPLSMLLYEMRNKEPDILFAASLTALAPAVILLLAGAAVLLRTKLSAGKTTGR